MYSINLFAIKIIIKRNFSLYHRVVTKREFRRDQYKIPVVVDRKVDLYWLEKGVDVLVTYLYSCLSAKAETFAEIYAC